MMHVEIKQFENKKWPLLSAMLIQDNINVILREQGRCSVMLTGGRTAERLYTTWAELPELWQLKGVSFYFGDERCVPPDHKGSNFGMVMRTLFHHGMSAGCSVSRIESNDPDREAAARRYDEALPDKVDLLLLGVGDDGHIASLFPGSAALQEVNRRVVTISGPKPPHERLTITPSVVANATSVLLLATGKEKGNVLTSALTSTEDFVSLPVRLACSGTWLLDDEAAEVLQPSFRQY